jgi:hypothetical protein
LPEISALEEPGEFKKKLIPKDVSLSKEPYYAVNKTISEKFYI